MGYRSEVYIEVANNVEVPPAIMALLVETLPNTTVDAAGNMLCHGDAVSWDPSCIDSTERVEEFLDTLPGGDYRFVRVGEDRNDSEDHGYSEVFMLEIDTTVEPANAGGADAPKGAGANDAYERRVAQIKGARK